MTDRTVCEHFNEIGKCDDCKTDYEKRLRDEFAMAALQGLYSDQSVIGTPEEIAMACYRAADAMLESRKK
jgi:hypothetical protein